MTRSLFTLACILAIVMAACVGAPKTHSHILAFESPLSAEVSRWDRAGKLYNQFDTQLIVDVIYNGQSLRTSWAERSAKARKLDEKGRTRLIEEQNKENGKYAQFYLAVYTPTDEWNDFANEKSSWSIFLEAGKGLTPPVSIEKVKLKTLPWRANLPFKPNFRSFYKVNFPKEKVGPGALKLTLSSLLGEVELTWQGE